MTFLEGNPTGWGWGNQEGLVFHFWKDVGVGDGRMQQNQALPMWSPVRAGWPSGCLLGKVPERWPQLMVFKLKFLDPSSSLHKDPKKTFNNFTKHCLNMYF